MLPARPLRAALVSVLMVALAATLASPASARQRTAAPSRRVANAVTLEASASQVTVGRAVTLQGAVDPASAGETVEIRDGADTLVDTLTTGSAGGFRTDVTPAATTTYHAEWAGLHSPGVTVGVRATITGLSFTNVLLFATSRVSGTVHPARAGDTVRVQLVHRGRVVATHSPVIRAAGGFSTTFPIRDDGTFRVRVSYDADDLLRCTKTSNAKTTPLPDLHEGQRNGFVLLLERRLRDLHYHLTGVDRHFDFRTADAVMAFRKVQRMPRNHSVTIALWRALANPRRIAPRSHTDGLHIEVDQTRQVLATVRDGHVEAIIHVSTGKPSTPTIDGTFHVDRKIAGYSPHSLYYPSYFDGNRAIHGWPDVPSYNASHGCVRVPYWTAKWIFGLAPIGTKVIVYHS
jgi:lipoprotein-anchoring transpeptidase ErfK/SrfK